MDEVRTGFTMTFDAVFDNIFAQYNPLRGPMILDYMTSADENMNRLVGMQYTDTPFSRVPRGIDLQIIKFWQMVDDWLCPKRVTVVYWVKALIAHCCALEEVFKFRADVLADPKIFYTDAVRLCRGLFGRQSSLKGDEGEETNYVKQYREHGHKSAISFWDSALPRHPEDSELMQGRVSLPVGIEGIECIKVLYDHVCRGAELMYQKSKETSAKAMQQIETAPERYGEFFLAYVDESKMSRFMRYPSLIRPIANFGDLKKMPLNSGNMEAPSNARQKDRWSAYLFYSGSSSTSEVGIATLLNAHIVRRIAGEAVSDQEKLKTHGGYMKYKPGDTMEDYNYHGFRQLAKGTLYHDVKSGTLVPGGGGPPPLGEYIEPPCKDPSYDTGFFWLVGGLGLAGALFLGRR